MSGISRRPVPLSALGPYAALCRSAFTTAPSGTEQNGVALAQQPVLQLEDANGNPVSQSGVVVTATVSPAGAAPSNATATTGSNGSATFSGLTLTGTVGSYTLSFGATGLTPATAAITLSAGAAAAIASNRPTTQATPPGSVVSSPPTVIVHDASGNPVQGVAVTFHVASGNGTVDPTAAVATGANGIAAAASWTLGTTTGTNTLTATAAASGITGNPVTFTAEGTTGAAARLAFTTAPSSAAQSGEARAEGQVRQLQDANGNPVSQSGVVVTATLSPAGATPGNATATTGS